MAALIQSLSGRGPVNASMSIDDWAALWGLQGLPSLVQTTMTREREQQDGSFEGLVYGAYLRNSVVFSCLALRARLYGEARFVFQQLRGGLPGNFFGTPELTVLEQPNADLRTRVMLAQVRLHADIGGHGFVALSNGEADVLRPDWTVMAYGSKSRSTELGSWDPHARIAGFGYYPGGQHSGEDPVVYLPEQVAHIPGAHHPLARNRGVSLIAAALREVMGDNAATSHKLAFFENAATPNLSVRFPATMDKAKALEWIELFEQEHRGALNAYKTMYLGGGVEAEPVGLNFVEMDFTKLQGEAETRIAAATGMHPVVAALSEGLAGSSLNAGNFAQAARLVGDATLRPLWGEMADGFSRLVNVPAGARLWYDERGVAFLRSDVTDIADITQKNAGTIGQLIRDGFTPESAVDAVTSGDMSRLVHTGMVSVQLQLPGSSPAAAPAAYRVRGDFWAVEEPYASLGVIPRGTELELGHPLVKAFPAMLEPVAAAPRLPARPGPAPIVSVQEVLDKRAELIALGRPAGYDSIARELSVSRDTVRRRMEEASRPEPPRREPLAEAIAGLAAAVTARPEPTVNVTVPPARVEAGAVQVSLPVTVEPAAQPDVNVSVLPAAVTVQPPDVRVSSPVTVQAPAAPDVNVTVQPADVRIEPGAVQVSSPVTVQPAAVTVQPPAVHVSAPVTVEPQAVTVNVPAQEAPAVHVAAPDVTVNVPAQAAPVVHVAAPDVTVTTPDEVRIVGMPARRTTRTVTRRGDDGAIAETVDREEDI